MFPIGAIAFLIGTLLDVVGVVLFLLGVRSRGSIDTQGETFSGYIWFILIAFGLVLHVINAMSPV